MWTFEVQLIVDDVAMTLCDIDSFNKVILDKSYQIQSINCKTFAGYQVK